MEPRDYKAEGYGPEDCYEHTGLLTVADSEYRNLLAIAQTAKNVWLWYSCVAEGGRVDEIEALGLALQRWESDNGKSR